MLSACRESVAFFKCVDLPFFCAPFSLDTVPEIHRCARTVSVIEHRLPFLRLTFLLENGLYLCIER
jgi:hypothetical protein